MCHPEQRVDMFRCDNHRYRILRTSHHIPPPPLIFSTHILIIPIISETRKSPRLQQRLNMVHQRGPNGRHASPGLGRQALHLVDDFMEELLIRVWGSSGMHVFEIYRTQHRIEIAAGQPPTQLVILLYKYIHTYSRPSKPNRQTDR